MSKKPTPTTKDDDQAIKLCIEFLGIHAAVRAVEGTRGVPEELVTELNDRKWGLMPAITATRPTTEYARLLKAKAAYAASLELDHGHSEILNALVTSALADIAGEARA
jgi:hypothetical protein